MSFYIIDYIKEWYDYYTEKEEDDVVIKQLLKQDLEY